MHVAPTADLVSDDRYTFPAPITQPVIMSKDGLRYAAAQCGSLRFNVPCGGFAKVQCLNF
jgi:hypothetical protein